MAAPNARKKPARKAAGKAVKPAAAVTASGTRRGGSYARRLKAWAYESRIAHVLLLWVLAYMTLAAFFFSEVLNPSNAVEIFPQEFTLPLGMHAVTAAVIAGIAYAVPAPRRLGPKAVAVLVVALSMVDYDSRLVAAAPVFEALLPILPADPLPVISLLLLAVLFAIGIGIGMLAGRLHARYPTFSSANILGAAAIVVAFLFAGQALPVLGMAGEMRAEASYAPSAELEQAKAMRPAADADKPDIYYIVLDRYTNNTVLKEQFGFDNTPFLDELRTQGFTVDDNAMAAYPYTAPSVSSTLNMSYHSDDIKDFKGNRLQSATLFHNMVGQSQVVKLLQQQGYEYHSIGSVYGTSYRAPLAARDYACDRRLQIGSRAKCLHGLEISQFQRSPFYRFANVPLKGWPVHYSQQNETDYVREQLTHLNNLANDTRQGGRLVFAHLLVPHDPFLFRADGSLNPYTDVDNVGRPIKQKFVDQTVFINTQVSQLVQTINEKSGGKAVIMLISDEGPYPPTMNQTFMQPVSKEGVTEIVASSNMLEWHNKDVAMKFGTLQAVRIPQATEEDVAHMSPVNAFRIVLDRYFGYTYGYMPACHFGLPDGRKNAYRFADITARLTGTEEPACKQFE